MRGVRARLRLHEEGGRAAGIESGYIATLCVKGLYTAASIQLLGRDALKLGEESEADLILPNPQSVGDALIPGAVFTLVEGEREIGDGSLL